MKRPTAALLLAIHFTLLTASAAHAQSFFGGGSYSRRGNSENVHWTLADWMAQKRQFRLMDHWLALHRQRNLFEFNLEGGQINYDLTVAGIPTEHKLDRYSASLFISIFGLEGGYEESDENTKASWGQLNVRVFGQSSQATQLILSYGARKWEDITNKTEVTNQYGAAKLQLYIFDFIGIDGAYRKYLDAKDELKNTYGGERAEYGVFLEYDFVRLFGRAFKETTYITRTDGTTPHETRDGIDAGIKLFF